MSRVGDRRRVQVRLHQLIPASRSHRGAVDGSISGRREAPRRSGVKPDTRPRPLVRHTERRDAVPAEGRAEHRRKRRIVRVVVKRPVLDQVRLHRTGVHPRRECRRPMKVVRRADIRHVDVVHVGAVKVDMALLAGRRADHIARTTSQLDVVGADRAEVFDDPKTGSRHGDLHCSRQRPSEPDQRTLRLIWPRPRCAAVRWRRQRHRSIRQTDRDSVAGEAIHRAEVGI